MPDYKSMYFTLFNKITDVIEELQVIQRQTEEMYLSDVPQVRLLNFEKVLSAQEAEAHAKK